MQEESKQKKYMYVYYAKIKKAQHFLCRSCLHSHDMIKAA